MSEDHAETDVDFHTHETRGSDEGLAVKYSTAQQISQASSGRIYRAEPWRIDGILCNTMHSQPGPVRNSTLQVAHARP